MREFLTYIENKYPLNNPGTAVHQSAMTNERGFAIALDRIMLASGSILPNWLMRSRIYSKKLTQNLRVVATKDKNVSHALVPSAV